MVFTAILDKWYHSGVRFNVRYFLEFRNALESLNFKPNVHTLFELLEHSDGTASIRISTTNHDSYAILWYEWPSEEDPYSSAIDPNLRTLQVTLYIPTHSKPIMYKTLSGSAIEYILRDFGTFIS